MEALSVSPRELARRYSDIRNRLRNPPNAVKPAPQPEPVIVKPVLVAPPKPIPYQPAHLRFNRGRICGFFGNEPFGGAVLMLPTVPNIIRIVAEYYGVSRVSLVSSRRDQIIVTPRHVAMYLARTITTRSLPEIGRRMGNRDHTTIMHGVRKIASRMRNDAQFAAEVEALAERFRVPA